ncbi:protein of unknown function [Candidatus Nitrospira inopinata]|uniref:Uncharacterized protein n=1 Tax=Candidatus Nitrospira inopinata TaxID=1715989 RepID=A0A0S4KTT7_9BACT|nr:protein of unknown function [Candidatus Nitrospira inopinata]
MNYANPRDGLFSMRIFSDVGGVCKKIGRCSKDKQRPFLIGIGSPGRTRTCDQPVNSRLLYQLSYRGTIVQFRGAAF